MSTRGWYEYYTINPGSRQITLSLQFYKWGDATPGNALCEWQFFRKQLCEANGWLPISDLDDMLRQQLCSLYANLPENFSAAAFLFMLQRAYETSTPSSQWKWERMDLPLKQRPDYRLGYEIGEALTRKKFTENRVFQKLISNTNETKQWETISPKEIELMSEGCNTKKWQPAVII